MMQRLSLTSQSFQDASFVMDVIEGLLDRSLLIILREDLGFPCCAPFLILLLKS